MRVPKPSYCMCEIVLVWWNFGFIFTRVRLLGKKKCWVWIVVLPVRDVTTLSTLAISIVFIVWSKSSELSSFPLFSKPVRNLVVNNIRALGCKFNVVLIEVAQLIRAFRPSSISYTFPIPPGHSQSGSESTASAVDVIPLSSYMHSIVYLIK